MNETYFDPGNSPKPSKPNSIIWISVFLGFVIWQSFAQSNSSSYCMCMPSLICGDADLLCAVPDLDQETDKEAQKESKADKVEKPDPLYVVKKDHHWDGIGKFYLGREISHVMGHQGAGWLERDSREEEERPDLLIEALDLKPGMVVADIGAGTGYYSRRLAEKVGKEGVVYGVDIQPEMLELLARNAKAADLSQIRPLKGDIDDPKLPANEVDLIVMVDVYHEFSHPYEMTEGLCEALKPGGRLVWVEYRLEDPKVPIKTLHKMSEAQVKKEAGLHALKWIKTVATMPWQHVIIFEKTVEPASDQ